MSNLRHLSHPFLAAAFFLALTGCGTTNRIVYRVADLTTSKNDLFVIREDGSHDAVLANSPDDETACGVTRDRRIVFTRQTPTGGDIYVVNEDGSGLRPLRATGDDEQCFGVTGNDMVIFAINRPPVNLVLNHDLYSISANSTLATAPITLAASPADELPVAIGWDNRVIFAKRENAVDDHRFSFYSIGDDGTNLAPVVGVFEKPRFVAVSLGNRMIWSVPASSTSGPPDTYEVLASTTTSPPRLSAGLNQFLHYRSPVGDLFCGFTPIGRVLLTSRSYNAGFPQGYTGEIYMMNDDGTNVVHINRRGIGFYRNAMCLAGNDNWIIVGAYADDIENPLEGGLSALWSYPASGAGNPIQLAEDIRFQGLTPPTGRVPFSSGRVLFTRRDPVANMDVLQSIDPDGTDLQTLATLPSIEVLGFTTNDRVIFIYSSADRPEVVEGLGIVPSRGQTPFAPLATRPGQNLLSFVYYIDDVLRQANRCRICLRKTDRGGTQIFGPPFP